MTDSDLEKEFQEFLSGDSALNKDMRSLQERDSVPSEIDEAIRKAAHKTGTKNTVTSLWQWQYPVTIAASLLLSAGIFIHYEDSQQGPYIIERDESVSSAPSPTDRQFANDDSVQANNYHDNSTEEHVGNAFKKSLFEKQSAPAAVFSSDTEKKESDTPAARQSGGVSDYQEQDTLKISPSNSEDLSGDNIQIERGRRSDSVIPEQRSEGFIPQEVQPDVFEADIFENETNTFESSAEISSIVNEIEELKATRSAFEEEIKTLRNELLSNQKNSDVLLQKNKSIEHSDDDQVTPSELEASLHVWSKDWQQGEKSRAMRELLLFHREYAEFPESLYEEILPEDFYQQFLHFRDKEIMTLDGAL